MRAYNVEVFDLSMNLVAHTTVNEPTYKVDALANVTNTIQVPSDKAIEEGCYIRIVRGTVEYFGVVNKIEFKGINDSTMAVTFVSFVDYYFNMKIVFDTNDQGSGSLEDCLKYYIDRWFISNADTYQRVKGLSIVTTSSTTSWGFNLKSDTTGQHRIVINLRDTLIRRSAAEYYVFVRAVPDIQNKTITLYIGRNNSETVLIETALPNVLSRSISLKQTTNSLNKVVVCNSGNMSQASAFFLHPDGTFNGSNTDRITPVVMDTVAISVGTDTTFAKASRAAAADAFSRIKYNNLIEIELAVDDEMISPRTLELGQLVNVIHDGMITASILTGYEIKKTIKLVFGTVRLDLTKILNRG